MYLEDCPLGGHQISATSPSSMSKTGTMQYGKTEADTLRLNGWGPGDILSGDEGHGPEHILITQVGEERFLCRWKRRGDATFGPESGNTTLTCRHWKKVGSRTVETEPSAESASIAEDILLALHQGVDRHHLKKSPSAERAINFLLSLARQEVEKYRPLKLKGSDSD